MYPKKKRRKKEDEVKWSSLSLLYETIKMFSRYNKVHIYWLLLAFPPSPYSHLNGIVKMFGWGVCLGGKWHVREGNVSLFKRKAMAVRNVMIWLTYVFVYVMIACHLFILQNFSFLFLLLFDFTKMKKRWNEELEDEKLMKIEWLVCMWIEVLFWEGIA
jgi:hypothetical protein